MIEAVIVCAVCAALYRREWNSEAASISLRSARPSEWFRVLTGAVFLGLASCGGVGLAIEAGTGRRPSSWGMGRWIWSITCLFAILAFTEGLLVYMPAFHRLNGRRPWFEAIGTALHWAEVMMTSHLPLPLAAVCGTATISRVIRDPEPDPREYLGRLFASAIVAAGIGWRVLMQMGR